MASSVASLLVAAVAGAVELSPGDILVVVPQAKEVFHVDALSGVQTSITQGGQLVTPLDVAVTADRQLLVVDADAFAGGGGLVRVDPSDGSQTTAGLGGGFVDPAAIALEADGSAIVVDPGSGGGRVFRVAAGSAVPAEIAQVGDAGSQLGEPLNALVAADGSILIADGSVPAIAHFGVVSIDPDSLAQTVVSASTPFLSDPTVAMDLAFGAAGTLHVAWTGDDNGTTTAVILEIDPNTGVPGLFPPFASGSLFNALTAEADGDLLTTVPIQGLLRIEPDGTTTGVSAFFNAFGVAVVLPSCSDGLDNDGNGQADFPDDLGCASADDDVEAAGAALPALGGLAVALLALLMAALAARALAAPTSSPSPGA